MIKLTQQEKAVSSPAIDKIKSNLFTPKNIIIAVILVAAALFWLVKDYFIVATVNGQPISRFELNEHLSTRYGQQAIDSIINERLIIAAARQQGIFATTGEIEDKIKEIEGKLEGKTKLSEALAVQGLNEKMFRRQLEIQVSIEKLFAAESTISAKEIDDYLNKNAQLFKNATDPAALKLEVEASLKQQKIGEAFDNWFTEIRKNAKINKKI